MCGNEEIVPKIRGMKITDALAQVQFTEKKGASFVEKVF